MWGFLSVLELKKKKKKLHLKSKPQFLDFFILSLLAVMISKESIREI